MQRITEGEVPRLDAEEQVGRGGAAEHAAVRRALRAERLQQRAPDLSRPGTVFRGGAERSERSRNGPPGTLLPVGLAPDDVPVVGVHRGLVPPAQTPALQLGRDPDLARFGEGHKGFAQ